jgi:hypothetical protein
MRIFTICPSRERPNTAKRMFDSFSATSVQSEIIFYLDTDDPTLKDYQALIPPENIAIQERMTTTKIINSAFYNSPNKEFYHITNDDFVYHTPGWDNQLLITAGDYGDGIFYGNDTMRNGNLCVAPVISGAIVRALGWLQMPTLTHLFGDDVWMEIGRSLNALYYHENVIIEHRHWNNKKAPIDDGYRRVNSSHMFEIDGYAFKNWKEYLLKWDIERIKNGIKS